MIRTALAVIPAALIIVFVLVFGSWAFGAECGKASYYGAESGSRTANGEPFNGTSMTAAMPSARHIGERYRVTYRGKSVVVRVNDTGGFAKYGRIIDLSRAAAAKIGMIRAGVGRVCLERLP